MKWHNIALQGLGSRRSDGSVLIIVMWVALGLVSITLYFAQAMYFEFRASDQYLQGLQAQQALEGGLRYAKYVLANAEEEGPAFAIHLHHRKRFGGQIDFLVSRQA